MTLLTKTEIKKLSHINHPNSISIFVPTHRGGQSTLNGEDMIQFKNQLQEVSKKLLDNGLQEKSVQDILKPAQDLLNDSKFWRKQSDGLAVFISKGLFEYFTVPVHFESFNYVSNELYLKPLIPLFNEKGSFYLFNLEVGNLHLYQCNKHEVSEIDLSSELPKDLGDVVGYDYEQKTLQFSSQRQGTAKGKSSFHGHLDKDSNHKKELLRYFQKVDEVLSDVLRESESKKEAEPLILACLDEHYGIYKKANRYKNLFDEHLKTTLRDEDIFMLHEKACELINPIFEKEKTNKLKQYKDFEGTGKTSKDILQIIPAAEDGKIETLFVENKSDILGSFDKKNRQIELNGESDKKQRSLVNFAAMKVIEQGGNVFLMEKEQMPNEDSKMNAIYRY